MFELVRDLAPSNLTIRHSFQTNGTLISDAWCELIKKWKLNIGISIDGPRELHDLYRKHRNGTGSFDRTYEGLRKLQREGIPFHTISVLTLESMAEPEKLLDFYTENEIPYVCFNIEEQEGANVKAKLAQHQAADALYHSFIERFLDLTIARGKTVLVREVEHSLQAIRAHGAPIRNVQTEPFGIISVDCEGNLSTFSPELLGLTHDRYETFCFGNVAHDTFDEIAARVLGSGVFADIEAGVHKCADSCAYYRLCGGGAPSNKIFENGSAATTETVYCRTLMRSMDVALNLIERLPADLAAAAYAADGLQGNAPAQQAWPG